MSSEMFMAILFGFGIGMGFATFVNLYFPNGKELECKKAKVEP